MTIPSSFCGSRQEADSEFYLSSDLIALSDTPVAVVCAGSKSILDIGLTLEYLEAHAVSVASYETDDWPAFYSAASGFKVRAGTSELYRRVVTILIPRAGSDAPRWGS